MYRKTYIEVNIDNLQSNIKNLINKFNNYEYFFGVVKGNAYGHGSKAAKYVAEAGVNYLAVASLEEGINIRNEVPKMPILCLEPIDIEYLNKCIEYNITITIHSYEYFKNLKDVKLKKGLKVHLKIDSGFNRLGIDDKNQVKEIADYLHENKNIIFEGIFSHFATSGVADKEWDNQVESFLEITSLINLDDIPIRHFAKSNALVNHPKLSFCNGCRLGLIMYGYDETTILSSSFKDKLRKFKLQLKQNSLSISTTKHVCVELKPCFSLHTTVIQSKLLKKGEKLGYGAFYQANEDQYISILPIGYADGFKRTNNLGKAIVNNEEVQIIGGIMMGMIAIKTKELLDEGTPITLIGGPISVKEVARRNQTTIYETLCSFNSYIPRVYYKCGVNVETEEKEGI